MHAFDVLRNPLPEAYRGLHAAGDAGGLTDVLRNPPRRRIAEVPPRTGGRARGEPFSGPAAPRSSCSR